MTDSDLVNMGDIANMLGVAERTPRQWRYIARTSSSARKTPVMPDPVGVSSRGEMLWSRAQILSWANVTGRPIVDADAGSGRVLREATAQ
jgi:hypothetical protein